MIEQQEINRILWAARRGMLELDLVLEPFVKARYARLSAAERHSFQQLLRCEDQDLYAWLMRRGQPDDQEMAGIVEQILQFTRSTPHNR